MAGSIGCTDAQIEEACKSMRESDEFKALDEAMQRAAGKKNDDKPWYKPCLRCRIIGHKWVSLSHYRIGEREAQRIILWGCCTRCGKEAPQEMRRITEQKPDA